MSEENTSQGFATLPTRVRERIEQEMGDAKVAFKLQVAKALADPSFVAEHEVTQAGRVGMKSGEVSELTVIAPLKPGGAERLRSFLKMIDGNLFGASNVGTLHDLRIAFLENDTRLLFCTTYDGDWDPYIDDFATKIPDMMDYIFGNVAGWPGMTSPEVKDFIAQYQIPVSAWYVGHPALTVADTDRLCKQDKALHEFLEQLN